MKHNYYGIIRYKDNVVCDFQVNDFLLAVAKIARLQSDEFPYAIGEVKELITGRVIYESRQRSIC